MAESRKSGIVSSSKSKPGQWKTLAALAGVLFLLNVLGGASDEPENTPADAAQVAGGQSLTEAPNTGSLQREIPWPVIAQEFLIANNPFRPALPGLVPDVVQAPSVYQDGVEIREESSGGSHEIDLNDSEHPAASNGAPGPVDSSQAVQSDLSSNKVQMVFRSARGAAAIINDTIYHEGDRIEEYEVASISANGVTLRIIDDPSQVTEDSKATGARVE